MMDIQEREVCIGDFIEYALKIGLLLDVNEPTSFKLGMMINMNMINLVIDTSSNGFDLHSELQSYEKERICTVILLQSWVK